MSVLRRLTNGVPRLRFHILDSETGQAHPLTASPFLDAEATTCIGINILGDVFGVICERTINNVIAGSTLQVWNWKTSHLVLVCTPVEISLALSKDVIRISPY